MTNEHTSLEKYIPHFIRNGCERVAKRDMCERWVGDWTNCNILTPNSSIFSSTSFSFCWATQSGVLRAHSPLLGAGSLDSIYSKGYTLISSTGCTCSPIDGWVEGQYVTVRQLALEKKTSELKTAVLHLKIDLKSHHVRVVRIHGISNKERP